jgi:hypothetical protein
MQNAFIAQLLTTPAKVPNNALTGKAIGVLLASTARAYLPSTPDHRRNTDYLHETISNLEAEDKRGGLRNS